jgi:hypothetical protein
MHRFAALAAVLVAAGASISSAQSPATPEPLGPDALDPLYLVAFAAEACGWELSESQQERLDAASTSLEERLGLDAEQAERRYQSVAGPLRALGDAALCASDGATRKAFDETLARLTR